MDEKIPRRMMRFYRSAQKGNSQNQDYYNYESNKEELLSPSGRKILPQMPSMDYEDLTLAMDEKNQKELSKIKEKNVEERLALNEIKKFKEQNKRLPTKEESDKIAENIFTQLKGANMEELYGKDDQNAPQNAAAPQTRHGRHRGREQKAISEQTIEQETTGASQPDLKREKKLPEKNDLKELFQDTQKEKEFKEKDDFDLGIEDLGDDSNEQQDLAPLEEEPMEIEDPKQCPNCKKETDKIIYCPSCGTAFCQKCSKKQGEKFICPKCAAQVGL